ncbi:MAG: choice-of-anchor V domain-containing protein [Bacteroidota bacterium]
MMLKKITLSLISLSVFAGLCIYDASGRLSISNVSGAPTGRTGSPGDGNNTCGGCHTGTAVTTASGLITSNIPLSGYLPGQTYTITASITGSGTRYGFQATAEKSGGTKVGTLIATNTTETQTQGVPVRWITHKTAGTTGTGGKTWTFNWTAPALGTGAVTFYAAFNRANNNGTSAGDVIVKSTLTVQEDPSAGFAEYDEKNAVRIFPNPAADHLLY